MKTYRIESTIVVEAPSFREAFARAGAWLARGTDDNTDPIDRDSTWTINVVPSSDS